MISINNAGQQPRLDIDLNVAYRAEDDDTLNDDRVGGFGTPHAATQEAGPSSSQIRVMSDSVQTSFSMRHGVPQAHTSLRAPSAQAIDAGRIVVSIENANQRISVTSSFPSASSLNNAGQSRETSEGRIPNNIPIDKKTHPVPVALRKPGETDETRISRKALSKRRLVPVPEALRLERETDQTRISLGSLHRRRNLVSVPEALRESGETDNTKIFLQVLRNRKRAAKQSSTGIKKSKLS